MLRTMRRAYKRIYEWSHDIAYSVGLIASDGCLQKDGRHIDLTSVDQEQLANFSRALGRDFTVGAKLSGSQSKAYRIQFSDVAYYDFLLSVGLTPNKSKSLSVLDIPDEYYCDFLRGLFDGDGSCYAYADKRWKSSFMYYMTFASASLDFVRYLQATNSRLAGTGMGSIRKSKNAYILAYAKKDSLKLFAFMWYKADVVCLRRKYEKLISFTLQSKML